LSLTRKLLEGRPHFQPSDLPQIKETNMPNKYNDLYQLRANTDKNAGSIAVRVPKNLLDKNSRIYRRLKKKGKI
jgi:hypothetical protein